MIVITEAHSPLGLALAKLLNEHNFNYLVLSDTSLSLADEQIKNVRYWHYIPKSNLATWIEENSEEIEFLVCCEPIDQNPSDHFLSLWRLGHQHQIPVIGLGSSRETAEKVISQEHSPFFWKILLTKDGNSDAKSKNTAEAIYHFIRNRQNSGICTLEELISQLS